jgi:hypothetical protein
MAEVDERGGDVVNLSVVSGPSSVALTTDNGLMTTDAIESNMVCDDAISALEEQVVCYQRLSKLAELQHEFVQHGQTEELLDVLHKRQDVLNDIGRLEGIVSPQKKRWAAYLGELEAADRARAEVSLAETRRLLEEITAADRNDALVLQQRKLNLGRQINQASAAKQINRNYAAAAYGPRQSRMDVSR